MSVKPFKIELKQDTTPIRVRLRKCLQDHRKLLSNLIIQLVETAMVYSNCLSSWVSEPFLIPKSGPEKLRLTLDRKLVNRYIIKSQFPLPKIEQEFLKILLSKYFAMFDLSNLYGQFP